MRKQVFPSSNFSSPAPPWNLTGSAALLLSKSGGVALVHYETSPVGPYDEFSCGILTRRGPRVVEMLVTSDASRRGGRENWGFPKELGALSWQKRGAHIKFRNGGEIFRFRAWGPRFPVRLRFFCVQTLRNQDVRVPFLIIGKVRLAWHGRQITLLLEDFNFDVEAPKPI